MFGSGRLVRRRAIGHAGVLLTATLTALVTAVLLVSATVLAPGVAESALQRTLAAAGHTETTLSASTGLDDEWPDLDAELRDAVDRSGVIESVTATAMSTAFTVFGAADDTRLALGYVEDADRRATLSAGRWPRDDAPVIETAVHASALEELRAAPGDVLRVQPLTGDSEPVEITVVGAYVPTAPDDEVWGDYDAGVSSGQGSEFTVVGPLLIDRDDLVHRLVPGSASATWLLPLSVDDVTLGNAGSVTSALRGLNRELSSLRAGDAGQQMSVGGEVPALVQRARDAASSTRALLLVVVAMLTVLGAWALSFTARLVAIRRAPASALMRARGAGERSMLRWSVLGSVPPAVLVAVAAAPLAQLALRPIRDSGSLADTAATSALAFPGWLVAVAVAVLWLGLMVVADLRAGRTVTGVAAEEARPRRAAAQQAGLDLVFLALGALGLQQLRRPPEDASEIVLVLAPALVVLAGAVVLIRALPWVARIVAGMSTTRTGVAAVLGAQEAARRTARHVAASILVVLAITVSVFSVTTQSTWDTFRTDTVDLTEPADVRLETGFGAQRSTDLEAQVLELPGVEDAMPVARAGFRADDLTIEIVGIDPAQAAALVRWSPHLAGGDPVSRLGLIEADAGAEALPVLATPAFAERFALSVGGDIAIELGGREPVAARLAGLVDAVPGTLAPAAVLADVTALSAVLGQQVPDEWWLATTDDGRAAAEAATDLPGITAAATHAGALRAATDDPSSAGVLTGLTAGLAFAAVFVLIGVVVHTVTSFQSRSGEYALLRAIGLGRRGVAGSATIEHGVLLGFSTLAGLGLGLLVAWLVVPHAVGGLTGLPDVPPLRLDVPWPALALMIGCIIVLAAVLIGVQTALTRRLDLAAVLREGT